MSSAPLRGSRVPFARARAALVAGAALAANACVPTGPGALDDGGALGGDDGGGRVVDGGALAGHDGGKPALDGGAIFDAGELPDAAASPDAGAPPDAGASSDGGAVADGGGSPLDGGGTFDGGDAGVVDADGGAVLDAGDGGAAQGDGGPLDDGGLALEDGGTLDDGGAIDDGGVARPRVLSTAALLGPGLIDAPQVILLHADAVFVGGRASAGATIGAPPYTFASNVDGDDAGSPGRIGGFLGQFDREGAPAWVLRIDGSPNTSVATMVVAAHGDAGSRIVFGGQLGSGRVGDDNIFAPVTTDEVRCAQDGTFNLFIAAASMEGGLAWARCFYAGGTNAVRKVDALADGRIVALAVADGPTLQQDEPGDAGTPVDVDGVGGVLLLLLTFDGDVQWALRVGDTTEPVGLAVLPDQSIVVALAATGALSLVDREGAAWTVPAGPGTDLFVARFDADGAASAVARLGGPIDDQLGVAGDVVALADGHAAIVTTTGGAATFAQASGDDVAVTPQTGVVILLDDTLQPTLVQAIDEGTRALTVAADIAGGFLVGGTAVGFSAAELTAFDATANRTWTARATGTHHAQTSRIDVAADGVIGWPVSFMEPPGDAGPFALTIDLDGATPIAGSVDIDGAWFLLGEP